MSGARERDLRKERKTGFVFRSFFWWKGFKDFKDIKDIKDFKEFKGFKGFKDIKDFKGFKGLEGFKDFKGFKGFLFFGRFLVFWGEGGWLGCFFWRKMVRKWIFLVFLQFVSHCGKWTGGGRNNDIIELKKKRLYYRI